MDQAPFRAKSVKKRRTQIIIETERVLVTRSQPVRTGWCKECCDQVTLLTVDESAKKCQTSARKVYRMVESEILHFYEAADGCLFICARSLDDNSHLFIALPSWPLY